VDGSISQGKVAVRPSTALTLDVDTGGVEERWLTR